MKRTTALLLIFAATITTTLFTSEKSSLITHLNKCASAIRSQYEYDPAYEIVNVFSTLAENKRLFIFLPGMFGTRKGGKQRAKYLKQIGIQQPLLLFNFDDEKATFGQMKEVEITLKIIKACCKAGIEAIDIIGHSRGGGVALEVAGLLGQPYQQNNTLWKKLEFSEEMCRKLFQCIRQGSLLLENPCINMQSAIRTQVGHKVPIAFLRRVATYLVHNCFLPCMSDYDPKGISPADFIDTLAALSEPIPMIFHMQKKDRIVSNEEIRNAFDKLYRNNPTTTFRIEGEGNHNDISYALFNRLPSFFEERSSNDNDHF